MASSSSSSLSSSNFYFAQENREYNYDVFPSFSGQDVRKTFLSHFLEGLKTKGINSFIDNGIRRSEFINYELKKAIKESRIAVVILSKNYASSSWCLNELRLIMKCKAKLEQTVMTIFYDIDPSDVRKQTADFGEIFKETCEEKTEEQKKKWRQALSQVADIAGEHSASWASEAEMISKIIMDISNELPSADFDELVGIEEHVAKLKSIVCLESDEVKIVGIWGPAGIGKTTIAKALYNQISCNFQLKFYKENVEGKYKVSKLDNISLQRHLQHELLSGVLDHRGLKIPNLVESQIRLMHQRVLLILDDLIDAELEALKAPILSLQFGSKVILISEDLLSLKRYKIDHVYRVAFPSKKEAVQIFSYSAFGQNFPPRSYLELVLELVNLIDHYPLGLKILGSSFRGKKKDEWIITIPKLKTCLDVDEKDIGKVIRFVYDGLSDKHRSKFRELARLVESGRNLNEYGIFTFMEKDWDIENWIQRFVDLGLFLKSEDERIKIHYFVGRLLLIPAWAIQRR